MEREPGASGAVVLFLLALGVLVTPALLVWAAPGHPWWLPYLLWSLLILFIARQAQSDRDDA